MAKPKRLSAARSPEAQSKIWDERTRLVREELDTERAASIAKTAKLKALRLEKLRVDAEQKLKTDMPAPSVCKPQAGRRVVK